MPCGTSLSAITTKIPFSSSPLISLYCKSVNRAFCIRTDISTCGDCLADIPAELADMPIELVDMPVEVMWFSVAGFSFTGCFQGRPQPRFTVGSTGLVNSVGASKADRGTSNSSSLIS